MGSEVVEGEIGTVSGGGGGGGGGGEEEEGDTLPDELMFAGIVVSSENGSSGSDASGSGHMCIVIVESG
jgi:hypothetical protein